MSPIFILNNALEPTSILEETTSTEWTERYYVDGTIKITLPDYVQQLRNVRKGNFAFVDGLVYRIDQVEAEHLPDGSGQVVANGKTLQIIEDRIAIPPAGLSHDNQSGTAEAVIKHYVNANMGPGAAVERQVPGLTVAADQGRGAAVEFSARYQRISDIVSQVGQASNLGWELSLDIDTAEFVFEVIQGSDRSGTVFFDVEFETALKTKLLSSDAGLKTFAYVAGQGEGAARTIIERHSGVSEPTGLDRREMFIDARDLPDSSPGALELRGDAKLAETSSEDIVSIEANPLGSFRYREHYWLGDIVTVRNTFWEIQEAVRIVGVKRTSSEGAEPRLEIELGQPWPTIKDAMSRQVSDGMSGGDYS